MPPVFLLSDFGLRDVYVGVARATIARLAPAAPIHDLAHELSPRDLRGARLQLAAVLPHLPHGAILLASVGDGARPIALEATDGSGRALRAVGRDDGLLSPLLGAGWGARSAVALAEAHLGREGPFDGGDRLAVAAGRLAAGAAPADLGRPVDPGDLRVVHDPAPRHEDGVLVGEVVWVDRFGNLVTNVPAERLPRDPSALRVELGEVRIEGLARAWDAVRPGAPLAYRGSFGRLELALREGDAAAAWGARAGTPVRVRGA